MMTVLYNEPTMNSEKFVLLYHKNGQLRFSLDPPITLQPRFELKNTDSNNVSIDILDCKTRTFYHQLLEDRPTVIPSLDYWNENLQHEPIFNAKQWKTLYAPLITHKHGDVNWKIAHRVLLTALSLNRMGVYATPNCHQCGNTDFRARHA